MTKPLVALLACCALFTVAACSDDLPEVCGDGIVNSAAGEQCDDGNTIDGDGCSADCQLENPAYCGNGTIDPGEVCDDGNTASGDGCSSDCQSDESCGNGIVDVATGEACDDGNTTDGDGCQANCALPTCGDGVLDLGEECDDANTSDGDGCSATCMSDETCGNGIVDVAAGESCDDGNTTAGDGCSATCRLEYCGNNTVDPGEACDDGNTTGGDGCSANCSSDESCGNGVLDPGESCDDGNLTDGDGCSGSCVSEYCGNGIVEAGEACDDGNTMGGDGCSANCASDESCGNGVLDPGESCDDGNMVDGDGCSALCVVEGPGSPCDTITAGATATRSGGGTGAFGPAATIDGVAACTPFSWINNGQTPGGAYWQLTWPSAVTIGSFFLDSVSATAPGCSIPNGRDINSAVVQYWDGASWVTAATIAGQANYTFSFPRPIVTTQLRLYDVTSSPGNGNSILHEWYVYTEQLCNPPSGA